MEQQLMGILNIYKEKGWSSFDVVSKVRGVVGVRKVGHTGTLDPEAEGVLPLCLGKATKIVELLIDTRKTYVATCKLGIITDTQDHTGTVLETNAVNVTEEEVEAMLNSFIGNILQMPPMYSALKVKGKRLYELARAGKTIDRKERPVTIFDLKIEFIKLPDVKFSVTCSKGTYIRTICHDLGQKLGTGGHMTSLIRTEVSPFHVEDALKIEELKGYVERNELDKCIYPVDHLFKEYEAVVIDEQYDKFLYNGNKLPWQDEHGSYYRVYNNENRFIGIYKSVLKDEAYYLKPEKVFL